MPIETNTSRVTDHHRRLVRHRRGTPEAGHLCRSGPYTTRITVRRPKNMKHFSGRVAVEIINMSAAYDWTANWCALWETIVKKGDVYVGITSKPNVFPGMVRFDAERYGPLSMANPLPPDQQTCGTLPGDPNYNANLSKLYENGLATTSSRRSER
jgi:hypothetical protein